MQATQKIKESKIEVSAELVVLWERFFLVYPMAMCRLLFGWRKSNSREHGASHPTFRYSTYCKFKIILFLEDIPASFETQPFETWETLHSAELLA